MLEIIFFCWMKNLFETSSKCPPHTVILVLSVPFFSGMALFEGSFYSMFPDAGAAPSECSSSLL